MFIPKPERLAKPTATETYFDLIQIWLRQLLDEKTISWLGGECRALHVGKGPALGNGYCQRIEMKGLSDNGLRWLIAQEDALINRIEIAIDFHFSNERDRDGTFALFHKHLIRPHHGRKQEIVLLRSEGREPCAEHHIDNVETRYDASRRARNLIIFYKQDLCRITGEVVPLLHLEWRANGKRTLERLGICSVAGLESFDHGRFWAEHLRLVDVSPERLGRLIRNRNKGTRSRVNRYDDRRNGHCLLKYECDGSIQTLLDKYGRQYPIARVLTRIPNDAWLPKAIASSSVIITSEAAE